MALASVGSRFAADIARDLRVAVRRMRRAPALATAIVLTIGLGLGAAAAILTASEAALVEPLPYAEPDRLVHLWEVREGTGERSPTAYPTLLDWRLRANSFSALEGYDPANITVGVGDEARMLRGAQVTAGFFRLLGVRMSAGRGFLQSEDATTGARVAIVTERFSGSLVGRTAPGHAITINGTPHIVVGVLPGAFHFALLQNADVFVPLIADGQRRASRLQRSTHVIGRLHGQVRLRAAQDQLSAVMSELAAEHPDALAGRTVAALPLRDALLGTMKPILRSLLVAVTLLCVIMGANLALLTLTRYVERTPELAMRSALGATRTHILRQLLVESLVPSVGGAVLAAAIGQMTTHALLGAIPDGVRIGMPYLANAGLDAKVIAVVVGVATHAGSRVRRRPNPVHHEGSRTARRCSHNSRAGRSAASAWPRRRADGPHGRAPRLFGPARHEFPQPGEPRPGSQGSAGTHNGPCPTLRKPVRGAGHAASVLRGTACSLASVRCRSGRRSCIRASGDSGAGAPRWLGEPSRCHARGVTRVSNRSRVGKAPACHAGGALSEGRRWRFS